MRGKKQKFPNFEHEAKQNYYEFPRKSWIAKWLEGFEKYQVSQNAHLKPSEDISLIVSLTSLVIVTKDV